MSVANVEPIGSNSNPHFKSPAAGRQSLKIPGATQWATDGSNIRLFKISAIAGIGSALILLVNAAKRSSLIPTNDLTQLLAPLAEILALGFIVGLFLAYGRRAGLFGTLAFIINFVALASLEGVEVVINLVFSRLPLATIIDLRGGPLGIVLIASSVFFLIGTLAFVIALAVGKEVPRVPLCLYAIGAVPVALRAFVPEWTLDLGLAILAGGLAWLAGWLWVRANTASST